MATFEVTVETITVYPHPNADRLEFAQVGLYKVVVPKNVYVTGDKVFYIPEYAVLPDSLIQLLGLEGKLTGKQKNRVKPVQLRGIVSQGLVAPLTALTGEFPHDVHDFAPLLGITKWEPEIPSSFGGDMIAATEMVKWTDIENIKKFPDMFIEGEPVIVDEKIHGTATCVTFIADEGTFYVSSKGLNGKGIGLKEDEKNLYWKMFHKHGLAAFAKAISEEYSSETQKVTKVGVFGETFGSAVQDLAYGPKGVLGFRLFDVQVTYSDGTHTWVDPEKVAELAGQHNVPLVPRLYSGPYSLSKIEELSSGPEQVSGEELHIREGVVVRPLVSSDRRIGKFVSDAYLTRANGTEYN